MPSEGMGVDNEINLLDIFTLTQPFEEINLEDQGDLKSNEEAQTVPQNVNSNIWSASNESSDVDNERVEKDAG